MDADEEHFEVQKCLASASLINSNLSICSTSKCFSHKRKVVVKTSGKKAVLYKELATVCVLKHVELFQTVLIVCTENGDVCIYGKDHKKGIHSQRQEMKLKYTIPSKTMITALAHANKRLYAGDANGGVSVYKQNNEGVYGRYLTIEGKGYPCNCMDLLKGEANSLVCGMDDGKIDIVDLKSNSVAVSITGHSAPVTAISAHPEKARFATVSEDTFVNVWELKGEEVSVVQSTSITKKLGTGIKYCQGAKLLAVTFFDDSSIYFLTTM
eukprot:jgi/Bigna1/127553/aug1.4_g2261